MKIKKVSIKSIAQKINILTLLWLFGAGQLFLFISRTQGYWFDGLYGIFTGFIISLAILATLLSQHRSTLRNSSLGLFILFIIVLLVPIIFAEKITDADRDAIRKILTLLPYVFAPGFWGLVFRIKAMNEKPFCRICIGLLLLGNIFLFRYYSENAMAYFRAGTESNSIQLSYAFANLWVFLLASTLLRGKILLFSFASLAAPLNVFLLSTRQSFVYISLIVLLLWVFWLLPFTVRNTPPIRVNISKTKAKTFLLACFLLIVVFTILQPIVFNLRGNQIVQTSFVTATQRWSDFIQGGYAHESRISMFKEASDVWKENPMLGKFAYEKPGFYAHQMIMDLLTQYGLIGGIAYFILIFYALRNITRDDKNNLLDLSFSLMFIGWLFVGMTVTQITTNPIFHFLLFYWSYKYSANKFFTRSRIESEKTAIIHKD